ncbi:MAG TPA: class I SAM-dependent methyltransferase [Candidatus Wallbacteria bacterium]|nr:class I SAM-dependent methyltransferase [Candidatus Wallbacteria bacterium]
MNDLNAKTDKKEFLSRYLSNAPVALALIRAMECRLMDCIPFANPILDLGCGDGLFSSILFKDKTHIDCAVDFDESEVELCYRKGVYRDIKVAEAEDLPFDDESFKYVIANDLLAHLKTPALAVNEAWRVLAPGGYLCFTVPTLVPKFHVNVFTDFINTMASQNIIKLFNHNIKSYFRLNSILKFQQWSQLLKENGFRVVYHKKYASLSAICIQIITSFYLCRGSMYKKALGRYIPFPQIHEKIITPITSWFLKSVYDDDSYDGENYLILAKKVE